MELKPIFSKSFLSTYSTDFTLSSVTDIRAIKIEISEWVKEIDSGKIQVAKEEEIKPRFINSFFGVILGFNYGNSTKWQLKYEKKSTIDGTKPDAALGYFFVNAMHDDVRVVIEIKNAKTDLDEKQNRPPQQTSVDQAFEYAPKMGGRCDWVIVSNIKEIRFYASSDRAKCQKFILKDLMDENKLKELLFLFHKDRFIKEKEKSSTDKLFELAREAPQKKQKPIHIIDKIYNSLKRFEGLSFVDPNYIARISPFNILDEHVWHYNERSLFTINSEIYDLLHEININNDEIAFSNALQAEITKLNVIEAKNKVEWIFVFLNHCLIKEIIAIKDYQLVAKRKKRNLGFSFRHHFKFVEGEEGITKNISLSNNITCDCLSCNYRTLNFNNLVSKLKIGLGNENYNNAEYAYGNYLVATNNYKTSFTIYKANEKNLKGREGKEIEYFLTKLNLRNLHNLFFYYPLADSQEILNDIKSIDLDKVIYDEIEFRVDKEVKNYLIDLKENVLIYHLQDEIEQIIFEIDNLNKLYKNGGKQQFGPDFPKNLFQLYFLLYVHINANYIVYDTFNRYKALTEKVFRGLISSAQTPDFGLKFFNEFILTEAILHIQPNNLNEILKKVDIIEVKEDCLLKLIEKLNNFTSSFFENNIFSNPYRNPLLVEQLSNYVFKFKLRAIFSNLFSVFSRLDISKEQFSNCEVSLLKFLEIEKEFLNVDLDKFSNFILFKGYLLLETNLIKILSIAIKGDEFESNKYKNLIKQVPQALAKFYPVYKIDNIQLIKAAISKCTSDDGKHTNYIHLVHLVDGCDNKCRQILLNEFEINLNEKFNSKFFEALILHSSYDYNSKNYFQLYTEQTNLNKGGRSIEYGTNKLTDLVFLNYIYVLYYREIDFNRTEFEVFKNLNEFELWLLNPIKFNYKNFDAKWLIDIHNSIIINRLKGNKNICEAIETELKKEFNSILAELKYKYFNLPSTKN